MGTNDRDVVHQTQVFDGRIVWPFKIEWIVLLLSPKERLRETWRDGPQEVAHRPCEHLHHPSPGSSWRLQGLHPGFLRSRAPDGCDGDADGSGLSHST